MDLIAAALSWFAANRTLLLVVSVVGTIAGERIYRRLAGQTQEPQASSRTSIASGIAYIATKGILSTLAMFALATWIYSEHRLFDLDPWNPLVWLTLFVARDFIYYWIHRAEHAVNVLWASHMVHHSATHFSFTTAVRMPWMEVLYKSLLALWAPLFGFHPAIAASIGAIVLMVGQFHHTELGGHGGVLGKIVVTPSAHRVHHGSNERYLDKNFGGLLIIWDHMFGTFEPETERVHYGLTAGKHVSTPGQALVGGYPELFAAMKQLNRREAFALATGRP